MQETNSNDIVVILSHAETSEKIEILSNCVDLVISQSKKIIISSHIEIPEELYDKVDYVIIDKNDNYEDTHKLILNSCSLAFSCGFDITHIINYDCLFKNKNINFNDITINEDDLCSYNFGRLLSLNLHKFLENSDVSTKLYEIVKDFKISEFKIDKSYKILDGKFVSEKLITEVSEKIKVHKQNSKNYPISSPSIAIVLVGNNPASESYVKGKIKACELGEINHTVIRYDETITTLELLQEVKKLNKSSFDGFIVQLPLPEHIESDKIINEISAYKDIDGFHPINFGKMALGQKSMRPATAYGILKLLEYYKIQTAGKHVVVVGRSNIVGKPISIMLGNDFNIGRSTVTSCDINTPKDLMIEECQKADIVIVAVGKSNLITGDMLKEGVVVIDVGINKLDDGKLVGDCDFETVSKKASYITPVPGGVGPMTIAGLILNTYEAWKVKNLINDEIFENSNNQKINVSNLEDSSNSTKKVILSSIYRNNDTVYFTVSEHFKGFIKLTIDGNCIYHTEFECLPGFEYFLKCIFTSNPKCVFEILNEKINLSNISNKNESINISSYGNFRWDLINFIITENNFNHYLEIGVFDGQCIRRINCENKNGVDPNSLSDYVNYEMTSDEFFENHCNKNYDIIFIDGLHHSEQVDRDIENSLKYLNEGGFILLHDCNPPNYESQIVPQQTGLWTGDVWKSIVKIRKRPDLDVSVVDTDFGVGVVQKGSQIPLNFEPNDIEWKFFDINRKELLNIISVEEFYQKYSKK
jgi:methylenetetrahydrofolate dehydrogenase (NADP+)/methenyltetrahydrofolate cyclohydrolase